MYPRSSVTMSESRYRTTRGGRFLEADGPAAGEGAEHCNKKLCFVATDLDALVRILDEMLERPDCYYVKYSTEARDGMYLGRVFLTDERAIGELWGRFKNSSRVFCSIQDDDFTMRFRPLKALLDGACRERRGEVVVATTPRGDRDPIEAVHRLAQGQLLNTRASWWKELSEDRARHVMEALWSRDLAHRAPQLPPHKAVRATDRFITWMGPDARYFTVPELGETHADDGAGGQWHNLTDAAFDTGIAAVNDRDAAIVWFKD